MVDSAVIGIQEEDGRYKAQLDFESRIEMTRTRNPPSEVDAPILRGAHSSTLEWIDLFWIKEARGNAGPMILKGIQTVEDALKASRIGVDGIYLSNHGGRQLDYAPSSIRTLLEIRKFSPEILKSLQVYIHGAVTRGTDVLKAICLGTTGIGLRRPFYTP